MRSIINERPRRPDQRRSPAMLRRIARSVAGTRGQTGSGERSVYRPLSFQSFHRGAAGLSDGHGVTNLTHPPAVCPASATAHQAPLAVALVAVPPHFITRVAVIAESQTEGQAIRSRVYRWIGWTLVLLGVAWNLAGTLYGDIPRDVSIGALMVCLGAVYLVLARRAARISHRKR